MKKVYKIIINIIVFVFILSRLAMAETKNNIAITINDEHVEFNDNLGYPFIDSNNRSLVPFRVTLEKFGAKVSWDNTNKIAIAEKYGYKVEVPIGKSYISKDGERIEIDTSAQIIDGRTYLPIRAVFEAFGATVNWDDTTQTVIVEKNIYSISQVSALDMPDGVYVEILPRVELLSGVLSQTSWMDIRGPVNEGNEYFQELKEFFGKYKNHEAIKIAEELTKAGFTYDAPPNFILSLGELPYLEKDGIFDDYLVGRSAAVGGANTLEKFRLALIDLAEISDFEEFFNNHREDFQIYINNMAKDFKPEEIIEWQRDFFGWYGDHYHTILAPAMFPSGGYESTVEKSNGEIHIYQVVRENGYSIDKPDFGSGKSIGMLAIHEWGHFFVNPSVDERGDELLSRLDSFKKLYSPVEKFMTTEMAYDFYSFYNEQIIRAQEAIAQRDLYGDDYYYNVIKREEGNGFYLTKFTIKQLEYYKENRDKYGNFKDFVPYLLYQYEKNHEELLKLIE